MPTLAPNRRRGHFIATMGLVSLAVVVPVSAAGATLSLTAGTHSGQAHARTVGSDHHSSATLDVVSGTTSVTVSAGALSGRLYRLYTGAGSGVRTRATLSGSTVRVTQAAGGGNNGAPTIDIELARGVRWTINLDGGATTEAVNMQKGSLSSLTFGAGVATASVRLPSPVGTLTLTLAGGASDLLITAPPGAPAQVDAVGGASQVSLDGVDHTGVAGGSLLSDPGWSSAQNRYRINLTAGVSQFLMSRT